MSPTRALDAREYTKLKAKFFEERPRCEVCNAKSLDVHHMAGRGRNYLKINTWMSVCRKCHDEIHQNPKWAREKGYLT